MLSCYILCLAFYLHSWVWFTDTLFIFLLIVFFYISFTCNVSTPFTHFNHMSPCMNTYSNYTTSFVFINLTGVTPCLRSSLLVHIGIPNWASTWLHTPTSNIYPVSPLFHGVILMVFYACLRLSTILLPWPSCFLAFIRGVVSHLIFLMSYVSSWLIFIWPLLLFVW